MQNLLSIQEKLIWFAALVIGFPLLMIILGELIQNLERKKQAFAAPLKGFRHLVLPLVVFFLILTRLAGVDRGEILVRIIETALWVALIYTALSLLNVILFSNTTPGAWQDKVPKLLVDLSRVFLVLVGATIVLSSVWGTDLGGLLAALGVGSLVLGLALQDSLGNVFSGVAMLFEQPFSLDDWLQVGDTKGRVVEITWRSVHLETLSGNLVIVPNSEIAQSSFTNLSRPKPSYQIVLEISFSYDDPPQKVIQLLQQTASEAPYVIPELTLVGILNYGDFAISYYIEFYAPGMDESIFMRNEFLMRLWYVAKRHNLTMPYPIAAQIEHQASALSPEAEAARVKSLLKGIPSLSRVRAEVLDAIIATGSILDYCAGETIVRLGEQWLGLYFIVEGNVQMLAPKTEIQSTPGTDNHLILGQLSNGELFGEQACLMTEQFSNFITIALTDVQLFMVERKHLEHILDISPRLSQQIAEVMEVRQRAANQMLSSRVA